MVIGPTFQWVVDPADVINMVEAMIGANLANVENVEGVMVGLV